MIQGAINQLLAMGAAAKKASDITKEKETKAAERMAEKQTKAAEKQAKAIAKEQAAKEKAMDRMKEKVQAKWDQNQEYQAFKASLGKTNEAPEALKRLAFEKWKVADDVMKKSGAELSKFSPDAQAAIIREVNK